MSLLPLVPQCIQNKIQSPPHSPAGSPAYFHPYYFIPLITHHSLLTHSVLAIELFLKLRHCSKLVPTPGPLHNGCFSSLLFMPASFQPSDFYSKVTSQRSSPTMLSCPHIPVL